MSKINNPTPPKNETIWAQYIINGEVTYTITSTSLRDVYHLCTINNNKCVRTNRKSKNPVDLEKIIFEKT